MDENMSAVMPGKMQNTEAKYAGFWMRVAAALLDSFFLMLIVIAFAAVFMPVGFVLPTMFSAFMGEEAAVGLMSVLGSVAIVIAVILSILYEPLMMSSKYQATLGMMVLHIKIVGLDMERISFGKAFLRYLAQYLSGLIFYIGFLMIAFTERKQGLHDIMVGTLVIRE